MKSFAVPSHPKLYAQDAEFKRLFGLRPEQKWPAAGMDAVTVPTGVKLWVNTLKPSSRRGKPRLMAMCTCGKIVGAGRIQQHWEACQR